ncbi:MAG TPA: hypothetical protein VE035_01155 [Puia sp.]|nr:hypothetical protein [Puia sp.]
MSDPQQPVDTLQWEEKKKIPEMINVLTILTFVGSGIGLISSYWSYSSAAKNYDKILDAQSKMENAPDFAKKMMGPHPVELAQKTLDNRLPVMLLNIVSCLICIYGAMQMRKLKKTGYSIYVIGEILPIAALFIFIGIGLYGGFTLAIILLFPILFIILYSTQLKHLS